MKISIVNNVYYPEAVGGAEVSTQLLAESLASMGVGVQVIALGDREDSFSHNGVLVNKIPRRPRIGGRFALQAQSIMDVHDSKMGKRIASLVASFGSEILHTNNLPGFSWSIWDEVASAAKPIVHTLRDFSVLCRGAMFRRGHACTARCSTCKVLSYRRKISSTKVKAVIGNSSDTLQRHLGEGFFPNASIRRVIHSIGPNWGGVQDRPQRTNGVWKFGFLGRPTPEKGLDILCDAMAMAPDNWELHIGARLSAREEDVLKRAAGSAKVVFHGYVRASDFMGVIDIMVVPSIWYEPLPRAAIEAQCHGIPVVASRIGGIPEVVTHRVNGMLFEPGLGSQTLLHAMEQIAEPILHAELVSACFRDRSRFSVEQCRDAYLSVYRGVLE